MSNFISLAGILVIVGILFALSANKKAINWRTVGVGLVAQAVLALFFVKVPFGQTVLLKVSNVIQNIMNYGNEGISFVWGSLADSTAPTGMVFFVQILLVIVFFSALVSALTYLGVIGFVIKIIGGIIGKLMGTSKAESFVAVSNVFMGQTEAPVVVGKYLPKMTKSEIFVVLVSGMGSVSGAILVGYNLMGVPMEALLLACALVPFGSLLVAKLLMPETEQGSDMVELDRKGDSNNIVEAISKGTEDGMKLALSVGASLIGIIALVALVNGVLGLVGTSLEQILGYIFLPFGFLMGLGADEAMKAGQLLGMKLTLNEFVAFLQYGEMAGELSERAKLMTAISLTGFANFSSIGICTAGLSIFAPEKRSVIAGLAFKGMIAGALVSLLSALFVGLFI